MCGKWAEAEPDRLALTYLRPDWEVRNYSFIQLERASNRFANALVEHGVSRGDRVAVLLPQVPETILTHLAAYKLGMEVFDERFVQPALRDDSGMIKQWAQGILHDPQESLF